jgi:hypothetical protein
MTLLLLFFAGCPPAKTPPDTAGGVACGSALTCGADEVCVQENYPADCENRTDTGAACPEGTTATRCGGAGMPCCCGPTPDPSYQCYAPSGCGDVATCDCVSAACPSGKACTAVGSETSGLFLCEELPVP